MALTEQVVLDIARAEQQISQLERQLAQLRSPVVIPVDVESDQSLRQLQAEIDRVDAESIDVAVDVSGVDRANREFDELNRELNQSETELRQVATQADRTGRELEQTGARGVRSFDKLRSSFGGFVAAIGAAQGVRLLSRGLADSIDEASSFSESLSKTQVVFREFSDDIEDFAGKGPEALGLSTQAALESASSFGNLFTALGLAREEAAVLSPQIVQLGSDLASFNNTTVDESLIALRAGLVGEVEPLRRLGVAINAAVVEQKAFELGLADSVGTISEAAKVQARFALILEQTTTAQGDFARTADGLANSQRTATAEIHNAQVEIGTAFIPALQAVLPLAVDAANSIALIATSFGELAGTVEPGTAAFNRLLSEVGEAGVSLEGLLATIVEINDVQDQLAAPRGNLNFDVDREAIRGLITQLDLGADAISRLREESNRAFLLSIGFEEKDIDLLIQLLEENVVDAATEARDALIHGEDAAKRFAAALTGITFFSPELSRFRRESETTSEVLRSESEALDILSFHADQAGVSLFELLQTQDQLAPSLQKLAGSVSQGTLSFLEQVDAINTMKAELAALPDDIDVVSDVFRDAEGEISSSVDSFIKNLTESLEQNRSFEINLARLAAQGFDALAAEIREEGPDAAGLLNNFLKDPAAAAEADALARGQATLIADALFNQLNEDIADQDVTPAFVQQIQALAAVTTDPEVRAVLEAIANGLSSQLVLTPTIGPPAFSPEALRATGSIASPGLAPQGSGDTIINTNIFNPETQDLATDAARAAQTIGSVVRVRSGAQ